MSLFYSDEEDQSPTGTASGSESCGDEGSFRSSLSSEVPERNGDEVGADVEMDGDDDGELTSSVVEQLADLKASNDCARDYEDFLRGKRDELESELLTYDAKLDETIDENRSEIKNLLAFGAQFVEHFGFPSTKWLCDQSAFLADYEATRELDERVREEPAVDLDLKRARLKDLKDEESRLVREKERLEQDRQGVRFLEKQVESLSSQLAKTKRDGEVLLLNLRSEVQDLERKCQAQNAAQSANPVRLNDGARPFAEVLPQVPKKAVEWKAPISSSMSRVSGASAVEPTQPQTNFNAVANREPQPSKFAFSRDPPDHSQRRCVQRSVSAAVHPNVGKPANCEVIAESAFDVISRGHEKPYVRQQTVKPLLSCSHQDKALENDFLLKSIEEEQERIRRSHVRGLTSSSSTSSSAFSSGRRSAPPSSSGTLVPAYPIEDVLSAVVPRTYLPSLTKRVKLENQVSSVRVEDVTDDGSYAPVASGRDSQRGWLSSSASSWNFSNNSRK